MFCVLRGPTAAAHHIALQAMFLHTLVWGCLEKSFDQPVSSRLSRRQSYSSDTKRKPLKQMWEGYENHNVALAIHAYWSRLMGTIYTIQKSAPCNTSGIIHRCVVTQFMYGDKAAATSWKNIRHVCRNLCHVISMAELVHIMRHLCNQRMHWLWLCKHTWNVPSWNVYHIHTFTNQHIHSSRHIQVCKAWIESTHLLYLLNFQAVFP